MRGSRTATNLIDDTSNLMNSKKNSTTAITIAPPFILKTFDLNKKNSEATTAPLSYRNLNNTISKKKISQREIHAQFNEKSADEWDSNGIKYKLKKIFSFYGSFANRKAIIFLGSRKFQNMLSDAKIKDEILTPNSVDILFASVNKRNSVMNFENFLNIIPQIAQLKYPSIEIKKAVLQLLHTHFLPLYDIIIKETDMGIQTKHYREEIDPATINCLLNSSKYLTKIYNQYFKSEFYNTNFEKELLEKTKTKSLETLLLFCQEFGISPGLTTKSVIVSLWEETTLMPLEKVNNHFENFLSKTPDTGFMFTLTRFLFFFQSQHRPQKKTATISTDLEMIDHILHTMDSSKGLLKIQRQISQVSMKHNKICQGPENSHDNTEFSDNFNNSKCFNDKIFLSNRCNKTQNEYAKKHSKSASSMTVFAEKLKSLSYNEVLTDNLYFPGDVIQVFENHGEFLKNIFKYYANLGEHLNVYKLKSIKFQKMLRDAGILCLGNSISTKINKKIAANSNSKNAADINDILTFKDPVSIASEKERMLSPSDCDVIYMKLSGSNFRKKLQKKSESIERRKKSPLFIKPSYFSNNNLLNDSLTDSKLEYESFLKAIELIAMKLYPEYEISVSIKFIIEKNFKALNNTIAPSKGSSDHISLMLEVFKEEEVVKFLAQIHSNLKTIYNSYCDTKKLLNLSSFLQFTKDFSIFPKILSKISLINIFLSLNTLYKASLIAQEQKLTKSLALEQSETDLIDENLFTESFILVSYSLPGKNCIEKILQLFNKMSLSGGSEIIQKKIGYTRCANFKLTLNLFAGLDAEYLSLINSNQEPKKEFDLNSWNFKI